MAQAQTSVKRKPSGAPAGVGGKRASLPASAGTLERVGKGERVVLRRGKKAVAAVIPMADLKLLEKLDDTRDAELLEEALAEPGERVEAEEFFRRLGLPP